MSLNLRKGTVLEIRVGQICYKVTKKQDSTDLIRNKGLLSHLKRLEGKAYVVALSYRNLPHTHFVRPVVIRVVGGLYLAAVLLHLPTTDGYISQ